MHSIKATPDLPATLKDLLEALERSGVRWSLLRPRETLASPQGDIDVLVEQDALPPVREILADAGFVEMPQPGPDLHSALYDEGAGRFVWVHVQAELRIAGAGLPAASVLDDADRSGIPQPGDGWLLWILLLRALVDKGELADRYRTHVQALASGRPSGTAQLESLARSHGIDPEEAVRAAADGDWERLGRLAVHEPAPAPRLTARLTRLAASLRKLDRLRHPRGLSVAVIGPDGAGKSTLVKALSRSLPLPVRVQYMGLTGGQLPKADALRIPGLIFAARVAILWLRYARGAYHRARGGIVLFERYTLDGAVPSGVHLSRAGRLSRSLQRRVCPLPDLVLLLDASGETMHTRSGEYVPTVLETWRAAYDRLRASVPQLEILDAERPADVVRRDAEARIWRRYTELRPGTGARPAG